MEKSKTKFGVLLFLSNLFLYLGLKFSGDSKFEKVILPLHLDFKKERSLENLRIKIYDSFGDLVTDEVILLSGSGDYFLTEISKKDIAKIVNLKTDKFMAIPFKKGRQGL